MCHILMKNWLTLWNVPYNHITYLMICLQTRDQPIYLGFTDISISAITADFIGLSRCWQNAVIFLMHPDNLRKIAQQSKSRQLSYRNASKCGFINKQTRLTMEHASAVAAEIKGSSGGFAICLKLPRAGVVYEWTPVVLPEVFAARNVWLYLIKIVD